MQLGGGDLALELNERDAALLTQEVLAAWEASWQERLPGVRLSLALKAAPIMGGVVMRAVGGHVLVDNSYEQRLAMAREALREPVMGILAQAPDGGEG
jgi:vacuolar-type H+-ATPase subunit E/Vma4